MSRGVAERAERDGGPPPGGGVSLVAGLLRTARPKQWLKNVLVFAAPSAAGVMTHGHVVADSVSTFVIFCAVASGVYFVNDALDADADRAHPRKRVRPVAAGVIGVRQAEAIGGVLIASGLACSALVAGQLLAVLVVYVVVQVAYSLWLKRQPVVDIAAVASGFVLRAIAGAVAVGVPISQWFLIVATFGSLFMVAGKRFADLGLLDAERAPEQPATYTPAYLQSVLVMSATVSITAYCLWAFENVKALARGQGHHALSFQLSIVPFTLALLRYGYLVDQGHGGAPEDVVLADRLLLGLGGIWAALFALGVYR